MHSLLLTLLVVGGANGGPVEEGPAPKSAAMAVAGDSGYGGGYGGCANCANGRCGHHGHGAGGWGARAGMPQSCYDPRYGCYGSSARLVQRYPAFHGTYYRRPYNYRNVFDYPWHADLHEPTSMFSYNVVAENQGGPAGAAVPAVNPSSTSGIRQPSSVIATPGAAPRR